MTLQIGSLTSDTVIMVVVGLAVILGVGFVATAEFGTTGLLAYVGWLVSAVGVLVLLSGDAQDDVDHSERPADVLEKARENNGEQ